MLKLEHIQKNYDSFSLNCTMEIAPGQITGLIGQNGAGKSTVFKAILNLISLDGGEIQIFGKNQKALTPQDKEKIGVVFSDLGFSHFLVVKDIALILEKLYPLFDKQDFVDKCRKFSLPVDKPLKDFSTGMQAKLKLLIAMSYEARLLLLDEPTAGLDVVARDEILHMLREYMEEPKRSILISSHISSDLEGLCDDIYMIHEGEIILHEETDILIDTYGILKMNAKTYESLDKSYLTAVRRETFGYSCLTNEKQFYLENYPGLVVEKGNIDEVITIIAKGERP